MLGEDIQVKIVSVDSDQVKIGIEAPRALKIYRREVYEAIQQENEAALNVTDIDILKEW